MKSFERVQTGYWEGGPVWGPQPLWMPVGTLLGACTGAVVGAALLAALSLEDPAQPAEIGLWYGGIVGGIVGLAAGLVLTFAVGSHLDLPVARERAFALTTLVAAVPLVPASSPFLLYPFPFFSLVLATLVSLLAGCVARWAATFV